MAVPSEQLQAAMDQFKEEQAAELDRLMAGGYPVHPTNEEVLRSLEGVKYPGYKRGQPTKLLTAEERKEHDKKVLQEQRQAAREAAQKQYE
jgi:hypothetical protein